MKIVGNPCEGEPHARFDVEKIGNQGACSGIIFRPFSTLGGSTLDFI